MVKLSGRYAANLISSTEDLSNIFSEFCDKNFIRTVNSVLTPSFALDLEGCKNIQDYIYDLLGSILLNANGVEAYEEIVNFLEKFQLKLSMIIEKLKFSSSSIANLSDITFGDHAKPASDVKHLKGTLDELLSNVSYIKEKIGSERDNQFEDMCSDMNVQLESSLNRFFSLNKKYMDDLVKMNSSTNTFNIEKVMLKMANLTEALVNEQSKAKNLAAEIRTSNTKIKSLEKSLNTKNVELQKLKKQLNDNPKPDPGRSSSESKEVEPNKTSFEKNSSKFKKPTEKMLNLLTTYDAHGLSPLLLTMPECSLTVDWSELKSVNNQDWARIWRTMICAKHPDFLPLPPLILPQELGGCLVSLFLSTIFMLDGDLYLCGSLADNEYNTCAPRKGKRFTVRVILILKCLDGSVHSKVELVICETFCRWDDVNRQSKWNLAKLLSVKDVKFHTYQPAPPIISISFSPPT